MKFRPFAILFLAFVLMASGIRPASAQQDSSAVARQGIDSVDKTPKKQGSNVIETDVTGDVRPTSDGYVRATYDNLSKLYWALNMLKPDDDTAIDNFLLINECELYQQYYHNDFEWVKIRQAAREKIKKELPTYPIKFEIMIPIELGRYDLDKQQFDITPETKIIDMRKLDFSDNTIYHPTCNIVGEIDEYPHNIIVTLNRAFSIEHVPVEPQIAQMYLDEAKEKVSLLSAQAQVFAYRRVAFLRLKVHMTKYKETVMSTASDLRAVVFATIDGVEVYADSRKLKPMYMSTTTTKRAVKFNRGGIANGNAPRMPKRKLGSSEIVSFGSSDSPPDAQDKSPSDEGSEAPDSAGDYGADPGSSPSPDPPAR
jgi:hypothetical protein